MRSDDPGVRIEQNELNAHKARANALLRSVTWTARPQRSRQAPQSKTTTWRAEGASVPTQDKKSLFGIMQKIGSDELLLPEDINHILFVLRDAICLAMHVSALYDRYSNLVVLRDRNAQRAGSLTSQEQTEFRAKTQTSSAIATFVLSYFVTWSLGDYKREEVGNVELDFQGIPEVVLRSPMDAIQSLLYYFGVYLETPYVRRPIDVLKMINLYFEAVIEDIQVRSDSFSYLEPYTSQHYRLEDSEFSLQSFAVSYRASEISVEFRREELGNIVGNLEAKHAAKRMAERLLCYDPETKSNPVADIGGLPSRRMGYGPPGTGKSMLIAAIATMLHDLSSHLGIPFLFWPMPDTIVSTFQGGSAERMVAYMKPLTDSSKLIYAPIDDAENNMEERTRQGVSAGVREVIGVFLRYTEGAYAVNYGNTVIDLYTNIPDQIDKAVLSRIVARFFIEGAVSVEDFLDQHYIWYRQFGEILPGFVSDAYPMGYEPLKAQKLITSLSEVGDSLQEPREERLREIFDRVQRECEDNVTTHEFFARFSVAVKSIFPGYSSRDVRNIQSATTSRLMDFDFPEDWMEQPDLFYRKPYNEKREMFLSLMRENMEGLSFAEVLLEETIRYLDGMVRILDQGRERRIEELVEELEVRKTAGSRFASCEELPSQ